MACEPSRRGAEHLHTLHEVVQAAHAALGRDLWDYVVGGTETETTVRRNRAALDRVALRPRVLRDVSTVEVSGRFLGQPTRLPIALAPIGGLEAIGAGGGVTVARAAGQAGVAFFLSSVTSSGLEAVAAAASGPKVFQLYIRGDGAWVDEHVRRAIGCGYDALCLTVDSAVYSRRERDIANRFEKPWRGSPTGMHHQAALTWDGVRRLRDAHAIPLILKGIATPEDASLACGLGVEAVYVSNHGGRQLDHGMGTLDMLPEVVAAVAGRASVMIDGGFSRGTDIVKALALGADVVGVGRLYCYGLAAAGQDGIARVLGLLEAELRDCLALLGVATLAALGPSCLRAAEPVGLPGVHSAFPLLHLPPAPR